MLLLLIPSLEKVMEQLGIDAVNRFSESELRSMQHQKRISRYVEDNMPFVVPNGFVGEIDEKDSFYWAPLNYSQYFPDRLIKGTLPPGLYRVKGKYVYTFKNY